MLKIAMLSMWHVHARGYADYIREQSDAEIVCIWDEDDGRGAAQADELGTEFVTCLDEALALADAVVIDAPTSDHRDIIVRAANAGKHIFTEKVFTPTAVQAREAEAAVRASGKVFAISFPHLNGGALQYAKKLTDEGMLGRLTNLRARNVHNGHEWLPEYWYDTAKTCGGAMMDLGAHPNYIAAYFLGNPVRVTSIFSTTACPDGVDDNAVAAVEFENQAIAVIETGFLTPKSGNLVEIEGTEGALIIEGGRLRYNSRKSGADGWITPEHLPQEGLPVLRRWMDAILYGKKLPPQFGLDAAVTLTLMTEGEYISHREGRTVEL
jgi:predicted dehydrogenase